MTRGGVLWDLGEGVGREGTQHPGRRNRAGVNYLLRHDHSQVGGRGLSERPRVGSETHEKKPCIASPDRNPY